MQMQLQLLLQKAFLFANLGARYLVQVAYPGSYTQERESSRVSQPGWVSSRLRSCILLLDGDVSVCWWWKLLGEAMEIVALRAKRGMEQVPYECLY